MMRKSASLTLALFASLATSSAFAQEAVEPPSLLAPAHCTINKAYLCKDGGCTASDTFGALKLPTKVSFDFNKRVLLGVSDDGFATASTLNSFAVAGSELIGQGIDGGTSFVAHADALDRTITVTVSSDHTVLNGFGTCVAAQ